MSNNTETRKLIDRLKPIINQCIENHPFVKSAIKAQKAVVWGTPDSKQMTVKVKLLPDIFNNNIEPLELNYNPKMEAYLVGATPQKTVVSIWYYQNNINNGIVMQDAEWDK